MLRLRGNPFFAPDGGGGNTDFDHEAQTRIAIKKAREAAKQQFSELLEDVGFESVDDFKAFVKAQKKSKLEPAEPEKGKVESKVDDSAKTKEAERLAAEKAVMDSGKAEERMKLKIKAAVAGVKEEDLDWAVDRYMKRKEDLPPSGVAAFTVDSFLATLKTEHAAVFRDATTEADANSSATKENQADGDKSKAAKLNNTGNANVLNDDKTKVQRFDARTADKAAYEARMREVLNG